MEVLIIQHGTLSHQFQSLMALRAIKQLYPQIRLNVWVPLALRHVYDKTPWIDQVIAEESRSMSRHWDWAINWSLDESTGRLMRRVSADHKIGFGQASDETVLCHDEWSTYIKGVIQTGLPQDIHLTDIWTTQALTSFQQHLGEPSEAAARNPVTSRSFFRLEFVDDGFDWDWQHSSLKWLALQLDLPPKGQWTVDQWKALVLTVIDRNPDYNLLLCGDETASVWAGELDRALRPLLPKGIKCLFRVGKTTFDQWTHMVSRCQWLIGFPGAGVQLASLLGTRVLLLNQGSAASLQESGPYGNGHYVLSGAFSPESIVEVWKYASTEWSHQRRQALEHPSLENQSVYRTRIRTVEEGGGVVFENMLREVLSITEWSSRVVGQIARSWYCGWTAPAGKDLKHHHIRPELLRELRGLLESLEVIEKISQQAMLACSQISDRSLRLHSEKIMRLQDRESIAHIATKLFELDQLTDRVTEIKEPLKMFTYMRKVMMHELRGQGLTQVSKQSAIVYQRLNDAIRLYRDWTKATIDLAKPRMVLTRPEKEML